MVFLASTSAHSSSQLLRSRELNCRSEANEPTLCRTVKMRRCCGELASGVLRGHVTRGSVRSTTQVAETNTSHLHLPLSRSVSWYEQADFHYPAASEVRADAREIDQVPGPRNVPLAILHPSGQILHHGASTKRVNVLAVVCELQLAFKSRLICGQLHARLRDEAD